MCWAMDENYTVYLTKHNPVHFFSQDVLRLWWKLHCIYLTNYNPAHFLFFPRMCWSHWLRLPWVCPSWGSSPAVSNPQSSPRPQSLSPTAHRTILYYFLLPRLAGRSQNILLFFFLSFVTYQLILLCVCAIISSIFYPLVSTGTKFEPNPYYQSLRIHYDNIISTKVYVFLSL